MQKARIKIASTDIDKVNQICGSINEIVDKTKVKLYGPVPMPTKKMRLTTRKSPDGDGKASFEKFEMRIHKRLIDVGVDERALRLIMRVQIPDGVNVSMEVLD